MGLQCEMRPFGFTTANSKGSPVYACQDRLLSDDGPFAAFHIVNCHLTVLQGHDKNSVCIGFPSEQCWTICHDIEIHF